MIKIRLMTCVLALGLFSGAVAGAEPSLAEKKVMKEQKDYLDKEYKDYMKQKCGVEIGMDFDWKTYKFDWWSEGNWSIYGYCGSAPSTVYGLCEDELAKPEVVKKIKKIVCKSCAGKDGKRSVSLKNGTLEWTSCPGDDANNDDYIKAYLMKTL